VVFLTEIFPDEIFFKALLIEKGFSNATECFPFYVLILTDVTSLTSNVKLLILFDGK
jgi:hypothetical protein